jgi:23S rRNA (guanosine2251-2'-O)-methyltransferase
MKKESILYGVHPLLEALDAGKTIEKVLMQRGLAPDTTQRLTTALRERQVPVQTVPKARLDAITTRNHQGVIAYISPVEYYTLEWIVPTIYERGEVPLILVLDRITDVRNFGAICRSAECAGVHAVVIPDRGAAQINHDAVKTSAGAVLRLPICKVRSLREALRYLSESGMAVVGVEETGTHTYYQADCTEPLALVMGSEEDGISLPLRPYVNHSVRIPMRGATESLNVSVAAGIVLFEVLRQRETALARA